LSVETQGSWDAETIVICINLQCQEKCFVTCKFKITLRKNNTLVEEFQKMSNKHGCF